MGKTATDEDKITESGLSPFLIINENKHESKKYEKSKIDELEAKIQKLERNHR